jgi:hypothetical protein
VDFEFVCDEEYPDRRQQLLPRLQGYYEYEAPIPDRS